MVKHCTSAISPSPRISRPGHTPGGTTWSWRSCEQKRCLDIVYADSLNSVSAPGFRFTGDATHASRIDAFENSMSVIEALPCDILLAPHPVMIDLDAKLARWKENPAVNPLIDASACKAYAAGGRERLAQRVAEEAVPPSREHASRPPPGVHRARGS